jgi:hypothetical protein
MGSNHNTSLRAIRAELKRAGWLRQDRLINGEEVWYPPDGDGSADRVRFATYREELGPKQVHGIRKAIERNRIRIATAPPKRPAPRIETRLVGPATPDEGAMFLSEASFEPSVPTGTVLVVTALDPVVTVDMPVLNRSGVEVAVWAAVVPPPVQREPRIVSTSTKQPLVPAAQVAAALGAVRAALPIGAALSRVGPYEEEREAELEEPEEDEREEDDTDAGEQRPALEDRILRWLEGRTPQTSRQIAKGVGAKTGAVWNVLTRLRRSRRLEATTRDGRNGPVWAYNLPRPVPPAIVIEDEPVTAPVVAVPAPRSTPAPVVPAELNDAIGIAPDSSVQHASNLVRQLRRHIHDVLVAAREAGMSSSIPITGVVAYFVDRLAKADARATELSKRADRAEATIAAVEAELKAQHIPELTGGPVERIRRLGAGAHPNELERINRSNRTMRARIEEIEAQHSACALELRESRKEIERLTELANRSTPAPSIPAAPFVLVGWTDERLAKLAEKLGAIDALRWLLGRAPNRDEIVTAALGSLEERLKGPDERR